jgi:hypothetical protein
LGQEVCRNCSPTCFCHQKKKFCGLIRLTFLHIYLGLQVLKKRSSCSSTTPVVAKGIRNCQSSLAPFMYQPYNPSVLLSTQLTSSWTAGGRKS